MISAKQYQIRLSPLLNQSTMSDLVEKIVVSDNEKLKARKVEEFTKGERPDNTKIGTYSNRSELAAEYAFFKNKVNPLAGLGHVDLMLTRSFVNKMYVKPHGLGFILDSTDNKTGNLVGQYGKDILGLNQDWFSNRQSQIYKATLVFYIKKSYKIA